MVETIFVQLYLEKILSDRNEKIRRIERATATRRKQYAAKTKEELDNIPIPEDFKIFEDYAEWVMESYISGFALSDDDGTPRCYYGNMGAPVSRGCKFFCVFREINPF